MTGSDDVVVARMAPSRQISSRFSNSAFLTARSSAIASTTRSTWARSSRLVLPVRWPSAASRSASSSLPRWTAFSRLRVTASRTPSTFSAGCG